MSFRILPLAVAVVLPALPVAAETVSKTVPVNRSTVVGSFGGYIVGTCASIGLPDVKLREKPSNGDMRIETYRGKSASVNCKGTDQQYLLFVYTPKKGFKGSDRFSINIPWRSHDHAPMTLLTDTYEITVR